MAYIAPSTSITFFKNTGLSPNHENCLYFVSESAKNDYFSTWNFRVETVNQSYQRANRNYCRVDAPIRNLYDADYMRFINPSFENKYFYAFITKVNYINNMTTEVEYQLDPLMTWMGDFSLKECFIERQHALNDGIGNNICEEGIPVGNYITDFTRMFGNWGADNSVIRFAEGNEAGGTSEGGMYSGCTVVDSSNVSAANSHISDLLNQNKIDNIVAITMIPETFASRALYSVVVSFPKPYSVVGLNYTPRNKKLFCYPYKYCTIENGEGQSQDYLYEFFNTVPDATSEGNCTFDMIGCSYATGAEVHLQPINYAGAGGYEKRLNLTHFPSCSWSANSYEAYLAQKNAYYPQEMAIAGTHAFTHTIAGAAGGILNLLMPGAGNDTFGFDTALQEGTSLVDKVTDHLAINEIRPLSPTIVHGSPTPSLDFTRGRKGFWIYGKSITRNYAMMLDNYFDMYGYAIKQHGTPSMNARPHWTYVKTIGCDVSGNVPASDKKAIEGIFDNGARFWHNLIEMGNYSLDNSPS